MTTELKQIGEEMNRQSNRMTQSPLFIVVADVEVDCSDGCAQGRHRHESDNIEATCSEHLYFCGSCEVIWEEGEELPDQCEYCDGETFYNYRVEKDQPQMQHGVFITGRECDEYIKRRSYALPDGAKSFGISAHRSEEMSAVLQHLSALPTGTAKNYYK